MNSSNIVLFSIVLGLVFVTLDAYVLNRFQHFARKHALNPLWVRVLWIVGACAAMLYVYVAWRRHLFRLDGLDLPLFMAVCLWYLPKLPIAIILFFIQAGRWLRSAFRNVARTLTAKKNVDADGNAASTLPSPSRRSLLGKAAWSVASVPYVIVANGMLNTLYDFTILHEEITLLGLPKTMDGFRLCQISDLHAGSFPDRLPFQKAVSMILSERPDAVVITGDFVNAHPNEMAIISSELRRLTNAVPVFGTLGNHDHYNSPSDHERLISMIRNTGIDLLNNEHRIIGDRSGCFILAGIDNVGFRQNFGDLDKALQNMDGTDPVVLLAHDPTFWDKSVVGRYSIPLMLSGHTHGGQVSFGIPGLQLSPASFVYEQVAGRYQKGEQILYVNRGLGTVGPPLRIGIPPEITIITLRAPLYSDNVAYMTSSS